MGITFGDVSKVLYDCTSDDSVRIQNLDRIISDYPDDPSLPDIIIVAMMEGSPCIAAHARASFTTLVTGANSKKKEIYLTKALGKLFALERECENFSDAFLALAQVIFEGRHEWPHHYIRFIQESYKRLQLQLPDQAAQTIQRFLEDIPHRSHDDFKPVIGRLRDRRLKKNLVSLSIPTSTILSTLEIFHGRRLEDLTLEELVAHLHPVKHSYNTDIINHVLQNLQRWVGEFPLHRENNELLEILIQFRNLENEVFPDIDPALRNQLIITYLFPQELFDLLVLFEDEEYYPGIIETIFRTFHQVPGSRDLAPVVCTFIRKYHLKEETRLAAVDFLSGMLTCHVEYPCTSIRRTTDHYRRIFQVERELLPDREIRSTLHTLAYRRDVPPLVRRHAFHSLLRSRPPDLLELLREGRYDDISDAPLLQAKLDATSEIKVLDYTDIIRNIWESPQGAVIRPDIIGVLTSLGHREIVNILLPASFDNSDKNIAQQATEALQNTGYSAEIEREGDRLHLLDLSAEQERAIRRLSDLSEDLKALYSDIHDMNADFLNSRAISVSILSQLLHSDIWLRAKGSETALKLAVEFRILREISERIAPLEREIRAFITLINAQIVIANQLLGQILRVEREMDECERGIRECESEIASCDSQIRSAENRASYAASRARSLSPPYQSGNTQSDRDAYESAYRSYQNEVWRCNQEAQSAEAEASAARSRRASAESQLSNYRWRLSRAESEYHSLGTQLAAVEGQIAGLTIRLNGLRRQLADLQQQFRACEARIISIQQAFEKLSEKTQNEQNSLSSRRRELAEQQTSLSRQLTQTYTRCNKIAKMIPLAKQEISAIENRINVGKQKFDKTAIRVLHETFVADEAAVANSNTLRRNQETEDAQYWRIDWTIRNTLKSLPFKEQYGMTIDSMATDIKRRKKL
ncbi:MAG: hypothetical protein ABSB80_09735 [Methanoregula sp.]|jgi:predicted  nucleic acid-binding Zn-ribbon protein|uniref:hypothetical protein n=1 Tax=Methanoregula sp. TaxID=2052170 RepID=UPI003D09D462